MSRPGALMNAPRRAPARKKIFADLSFVGPMAPIRVFDAAGRVEPTIEDIRERAYFIYLNRCANGVPGDADSDWRQALRELREQS